MEKVTPCPVTDCWWWTAARNSYGYGRFSSGGKQLLAHRVAHELFVGPIPAGLWVLHTCNRGHEGCVNPSHLKLGTHPENMRDMARAGSNKGERNSRAKLTDELVREIRASTDTQQAIAARLGVARSRVSRIRTRKSWAHVTEVTL